MRGLGHLLLFLFCWCGLVTASEIQTRDIVSTLEKLNTELQIQGTISIDCLLRLGPYLRPLRLALAEQFVTADNMAARLFVGRLFILMGKLSEEEITGSLSPELAFEYVVSFSAFINVCSTNAYKYVNLMGTLGKVIGSSLQLLDECVNWVLLVSRPAIANIPSFLYGFVNGSGPKSLFTRFYRKFIECFGLRKGFSYGGYRRALDAYVPLDTIAFILGTSKPSNLIGGDCFVDREQLCKVLQFGSVSDPKDTFQSAPEVFINILTDLTQTHHKSERVLEYLIRFIFSTGVIKILAHNCDTHHKDMEKLFLAVVDCTAKGGVYAEMIDEAIGRIEPDCYRAFARVMYWIPLSLRSTDLDWGHVHSIFSGTKAVKCNEKALAAISGVLEHLGEASVSEYISCSIYQDWKDRIRRLLKLDKMKELAPFNVILPHREGVRLLYWMFVHFHSELRFLGRLLICRMGRLLEGNSLNALEGISALLDLELEKGIIEDACFSSFHYPIMDQPSLIYTIIYYTSATDHQKHDQDIVNATAVGAYLYQALLYGGNSHDPDYFRKLYESLDLVHEYLNKPLVHEIFCHLVLVAKSDPASGLDFGTVDFSGYINYIQSRRLVSAACINSWKI